MVRLHRARRRGVTGGRHSVLRVSYLLCGPVPLSGRTSSPLRGARSIGDLAEGRVQLRRPEANEVRPKPVASQRAVRNAATDRLGANAKAVCTLGDGQICVGLWHDSLPGRSGCPCRTASPVRLRLPRQSGWCSGSLVATSGRGADPTPVPSGRWPHMLAAGPGHEGTPGLAPRLVQNLPQGSRPACVPASCTARVPTAAAGAYRERMRLIARRIPDGKHRKKSVCTTTPTAMSMTSAICSFTSRSPPSLR